MIDQKIDNDITRTGLQENRHGERVFSQPLRDDDYMDNKQTKRGWTKLVEFEVAFLKNWEE